jgi:hypothetical protein
MDQALEQIRQSRILSGQKLEAPVRTLELVNRYHATAEALENCGRLIRTLEIERYWGTTLSAFHVRGRSRSGRVQAPDPINRAT